MTFSQADADSLLAIIDGFGCNENTVSYERFGIDHGNCENFPSLFSGTVPAGGACNDSAAIYLYPVSDCEAGLVCDISGTCVEPCSSRFTDDFIEGEQCENGFEVLGDCARGLGCASSDGDRCRRLATEGGTCLYNMCAPGYYCEVIISTRTCRESGTYPKAAVCDFLNEVERVEWECKSDAECDDANACTIDKCVGGVCTPAFADENSVCDDGLYCTGTDMCDSSGGCTKHSGDPCSGGAECNSECNEDADNCFQIAETACEDSLFCTVDDKCDGSGTCVSGPRRDCSDDNECNFDKCDEEFNRCVHLDGQEGIAFPGTCTDDIDQDCNGMTDGLDPDCIPCTEGNMDPRGYYSLSYKYLKPGELVYQRYTHGFMIYDVDCPIPVHVEGDGNPEFEIYNYGNWAKSGYLIPGEYLRVRSYASETPGGVHEVRLYLGNDTASWTLTTCEGSNCMEGQLGGIAYGVCIWSGSWSGELITGWTCPGSDELIMAEDIIRDLNGNDALDECPEGATCQIAECSSSGYSSPAQVGTLRCPDIP